jgi:hypothetical protein
VGKVTSTKATQAYQHTQRFSWKMKPMLGYSVLSDLIRPRPTNSRTVSVLQQQVLLPRTAADELPPYRDQPWIIDKRGYRKIDPSMTLVPVSRL